VSAPNELSYKSPQVGASAGYDTNISFTQDTPIKELEYVNPQVSVHAGFDTRVNIDTPIDQSLHLTHNRPQVSSHAGYNTMVNIDGVNEYQDIELATTKLNPMANVNPESDFRYNNTGMNVDHWNSMNRKVKPQGDPNPGNHMYRHQNDKDRQLQFRQKISKFGAYQIKGYEPVKGVPHSNSIVNLKKVMMNSPPKKGYRF